MSGLHVAQQRAHGVAVDQVVVAGDAGRRPASAPRAAQLSTTKQPRNPAPPVTSTRFSSRSAAHRPLSRAWRSSAFSFGELRCPRRPSS